MPSKPQTKAQGRAFVLACFFFLLAAGCGRPHVANFEDDIEIVVNVDPAHLPQPSTVDILHSPYVVGARFNVSVLDDGDPASEALRGWTFESSDPSVIQVLGRLTTLTVSVAAAGAGKTTFIARDAVGNIVGQHTVAVKAPDEAIVVSNADRLVGRSDADAEVDGSRVLIDGTAAFLVEWFADGVELSGSGALSVADTGTASVSTVQLPSSPVHDWFLVEPVDSDPLNLRLLAGPVDVRPFVVLPTAESHIASVALVGDSESGAEKDDRLRLLGQAYDETGQTIRGVDFNWLVDGQTDAMTGDCVVYSFEPAADSDLVAATSNRSASLAIRASSVEVLSSNLNAYTGTQAVTRESLAPDSAAQAPLSRGVRR